MNVDGINVIQVVLHLAVDVLQLGNEAVQKFQVMHQAQSLGNVFGSLQDVHERVVHLTAAAELVIYQAEAFSDQTLDTHVQLNGMFLGQFENPHQNGRVCRHYALVGYDQLTLEYEAAVPNRSPHEVAQDFQRPFVAPDTARDQAGCKMFDLVGVPVVITHEIFHSQHPFAVLVAHETGQMHLGIEGQLVVLAAAIVMQLVADAPEIVQSCVISLQFLVINRCPL